MEELKLEKRYKSLKVGRTRAGHDFFLFPFGLAARLIGSTSADLMPDGTGNRYMYMYIRREGRDHAACTTNGESVLTPKLLPTLSIQAHSWLETSAFYVIVLPTLPV
jgi:hypothetical protein